MKSMPRWKWLLAAWGLSAWSAPAQEVRAVDEYTLKAALLFNFAHFIEWPASERGPDSQPLVVCLTGSDPFGGALKNLEKRKVRGQAVEVRQISNLSEAQQCHLLYAERVPPAAWGAQWRQGLGDATVVVVSSDPGALKRGAQIEFVMQGNRVRWMLDIERMRAQGLRVSAKLIEVSMAHAPA